MLCFHAHAKINWTLDILGTRADGYHLMDMLMQSVSLCDTLFLEEAETLELVLEGGVFEKNGVGDDIGVPTGSEVAGAALLGAKGDCLSAGAVTAGPNNLVWRAAERLRALAKGPLPGARMRLCKRIPAGAGMGGGSADAAAALIGLNQLWKLGLSSEELARVGLSLGADVPFMLHGGLARVRGIGEVLSPLPPPPAWLVLLQPCDGLSTREVFAAFDALPSDEVCHPDTEAAQAALVRGDLRALGRAMQNVLERVSIKHRPVMRQAMTALEAAGAVRAMMTGSGSVVYGVFESRDGAESAHAKLRGKYSVCMVTRTENGAGVAEDGLIVPDGSPV